MAMLHVTYKPDNGMVKGMGGLMMSNGTQTVAMAIAQSLRKHVLAAAVIAEGDARFYDTAPGRILEVFSKSYVRPIVEVLNDGGHWNPRRAARYEVTGRYEGKDEDGRPKSSPVTLEFGSHYNEGTKQDRPDYRVLGRAVAALAASRPGIDLGMSDEW